MKRHLLLSLGFLLAGMGGHAAHAQLPAKPAPSGMVQVATHGGGTGRILTSHMSGTTSARKILVALKMASADYFDGPMTVTRAFADKNDRFAQAAFTAKLKGTPVRGVAAVAMEGDSGQATLLFDNAKTFAQSFRLLARSQSGSGGKSGKNAMANVKLTRQTAPDGSCQISLPPGYKIVNSYKGTLDIVGPNNVYMGLGGPAICTRPEAAGMFPGIPAVSFSDPVQATVDYVAYMGRKAGGTAKMTVLDAKPVPNWTAGRAAFIRYRIAASGKTQEGFGLFSIAQTDVNQALLYQSFMVAPPSIYRTAFPLMLRAWGTWSINPSVFTERLMAAAQSMRGMSDIITSGNAEREKTNARVSEAWSDVFRDQGTWANPSTGARYKVSNTVTNGGGIPYENGVALQPVPLGDL